MRSSSWIRRSRTSSASKRGVTSLRGEPCAGFAPLLGVVSRVLAIVLGLVGSVAAGNVAQADDLVIDIDAVGQLQGYDDAVTSQFTIDLLTTDANRISEAIANNERLQREALSGTLFTVVSQDKAVDEQSQIISQTYGTALFSTPAKYSDKNSTKRAVSMWWLVVIGFGVCGVCGYLIAHGLLVRTRKQFADVY